MSDGGNVIDTRDRDEDDEYMEDDPDLDAMRARVAEMEAEAEKLRQLQDDQESKDKGTAQTDGATNAGESSIVAGTEEDAAVVDSRSIYVGNVDYGSSPEEIQQHFASCGTINRVTILCDKYTGRAKGYAYVEFADPSLVQQALTLNESLFRGRQLSVVAKRTNIPGMSARGRGRGRGGYRGGYQPRGGYNPYARGRGFRGRGRGRGY